MLYAIVLASEIDLLKPYGPYKRAYTLVYILYASTI